MGRWHLPLFYQQMRLFFPANLEPTFLILSGFVVPHEKGMTFHYRIQEESQGPSWHRSLPQSAKQLVVNKNTVRILRA